MTKKITKCFLDCEFTGLHQNTTLISIALVSECGKSFYAEFTDFDTTQVNDWLKEYVIAHLEKIDLEKLSLWKAQDRKRVENKETVCYIYRDDPGNLACYGNSLGIKTELESWLKQFESIEIWADCPAYDSVLFNQLFGGAFSIPGNIFYIPFDLATAFKVKGVDPDVNRESYILPQVIEKAKHTALHDALVAKACYEKLIGIPVNIETSYYKLHKDIKNLLNTKFPDIVNRVNAVIFSYPIKLGSDTDPQIYGINIREGSEVLTRVRNHYGDTESYDKTSIENLIINYNKDIVDTVREYSQEEYDTINDFQTSEEVIEYLESGAEYLNLRNILEDA